MNAFILDRLSEASTWRGLMAMVTAGGVAISPEQAEAVIAAGLAVIGALGALFPDSKDEK